jgi:hypothetical protein
MPRVQLAPLLNNHPNMNIGVGVIGNSLHVRVAKNVFHNIGIVLAAGPPKRNRAQCRDSAPSVSLGSS